MAKKIHSLVSQLKQIVSDRRRFVNISATVMEYLLFPISSWLLLWCSMHVFAAFAHGSTGSTNGSISLIETFCLPLLTLFLAYRLLALLIHLFLEQEIYTVLVDLFLFPLFLTYVGIEVVGLFTDISLLGDTQLFTVAGTTVTLRGLFIASIGLYLWFAGVSGLAQFLRKVLLARMQVDEGALDASLILVRYFLIGFGLFVAFSELKLDSTAIAAISGGLAVGIGFGLKDIVINFISGIMLLFERSLHPGDVIEVKDKIGRVEEINLRATIIKTDDHVELIIPNQLFWTDILTSYTRKSRLVRFHLDIPVSYDHAPETIIDILQNVIRDHAKISTSLMSNVHIDKFSDQYILYKLKIWTDDPIAISEVRSSLYRCIWLAFEQHGIDPTSALDISIRDRLPADLQKQLSTTQPFQ